MATDFRALLQDTSETIEEAFRKQMLPECWLVGKIGQHSFGESRVKQTPFVRFVLSAHELHPQYATDELKEIVSHMEPPLPNRTFNVDGWLNSIGSKRRVTNFLDRIVGHPNRNMEARIPETQGVTVMFKAVPRLDAEGKETGYSDVDLGDVHLFRP